MRSFRDQSILKTRVGSDFMILFNSWYYSFSPAMATHLQTHPTQRAIFRETLYPLFGILYVSYYSYLLLFPLNSDVAVAVAGVVAASLIGLVYLSPVLYLCSRVNRRKFGSLHLAPSRLCRWIGVSVVMVIFAYCTGQVVLLSIATTGLVLSVLTLGCVLGALALIRFELFCTGLSITAWRANVIKSVSYLAEKTLSSCLRSLDIVKRRF